MLKGFKKMSRKRQIITIAVSVVIIALIVVVIYQNFRPEPAPSYQLATVEKGDIQSTFDTKATVESTSTENFSAVSGVKVLTVNVAVGDKVKAGDVLATFDVASINGTLAEYKSAYDKANAAYTKANNSVANAKAGITTADADIKSTEKEISALEADIAAAKNAQVTQPQIDSGYSQEQLAAIIKQLQGNGVSEEQIAAIVNSLKESVGNIDVKDAITDSIAGKELQLVQKQAQLATLETQRTVYEAQTDDTISSLYKSVVEQKKADYDAFKVIYESLKAGWVASADGIITEINIEAGKEFIPAEKSSSVDLSSIIGSMTDNSEVMSTLTDILGTTNNSSASVGNGIVLENYGEFIASFTVGKYDLLDIKVGQVCTVSSLDSTYDATVSYVSATATESTGLNIGSIASSLTGSSSNSASAVVKVKIQNPDEKIVIGFDVDVKVNTEKIEDVVKIPVDCVTTEDSLTYVYVYNADKKTVEKREIELGVFSDEAYEITSGLTSGERIVMNPKSALTDGAKITATEA